MLRSLFIAVAVFATHIGAAQAADDLVRMYADSLVALVVDDDQEALYQQLAPSLRASYSREDLLNPLLLIQKNYGKINSYDYRQRIKSQTSFSGRLVGHLTYWYAVEMQPATPGAFLLVKVTEENGHLFTAGIDFNQVQGPIPSFLKPRKEKKDQLAQQYNIPRDVWLANLKTIMTDGLCNGPGSPFKLIYKGTAEECVPELGKLFDRCAKEEPRVVLPEKITSVPEATNYGRVMAECVSAHYQGGAALDAFYKLQDLTNK